MTKTVSDCVYMSTYLTKINQFLIKVRNAFPAPLPRGMEEFETWSNALIVTYDLPDNDSIKFALATMILHLGPTECDKPKRYFARAVLKGMAAQVASAVMYNLKEKQKAEEAAKLAVVTANGQATSDVITVSN